MPRSGSAEPPDARKTLIRLWAARIRTNRTNVLCRIVESFAVVKLRMKWVLYRASTEFRNDAAP
jgi:hypothetical protein